MQNLKSFLKDAVPLGSGASIGALIATVVFRYDTQILLAVTHSTLLLVFLQYFLWAIQE